MFSLKHYQTCRQVLFVLIYADFVGYNPILGGFIWQSWWVSLKMPNQNIC